MKHMLFQPIQPGLRPVEKVDQPNQPKTVFSQKNTKNPTNQSNQKRLIPIEHDLNNATSTKCNVSCGIPQGSVLCPLLFLLYVNDVHCCSDIFDFHLFADDANLFYKSKSLSMLEIIKHKC